MRAGCGKHLKEYLCRFKAAINFGAATARRHQKARLFLARKC